MKWRRRPKTERLPVEQLPVRECANCGTSFQGYFCPGCGQSTNEFDRPFGFVFYDFLGNFFSFDSRFFRTFRYLIFRPGFLSSEFLAGRRERYAPPIRTFIFLSFLLFLLVQLLTDKALDKPIPDEREQHTTELRVPDAEQEIAFQPDTGRVAPDSTARDSAGFTSDIVYEAGSVAAGLERYANTLRKKLEHETDPDRKKQQQNLVNLLGSPHSMASAFLKYLSWAFFILLPVFAFLLSLLYARQHLHYIRHLIFAVHIHSFLFLLNMLMVLAMLIFWSMPEWVSLLVFVGMQVYVFAALKHFYGQGYRKTALKFVVLGMLYFFLLVFVFIGVTYLVFSSAF
ncbi:MAG: DUF3667 domain-containing protein [Mangrovibacterium sp.]